MAIDDFDEQTFVAFTDISGFKEMMKDEERAVQALDNLNKAGYEALDYHKNVNGFFISDCGVLFVRDTVLELSKKLLALLKVIGLINHNMLDNDFMLTTSIAYGRFSYHQRLEFRGIEKHPLYGNAYLAAFLDNEKGSPRIQPGQCRILSHGLDSSAFDGIDKLRRKGEYWYYYWNVKHASDIEQFESQYSDTYNMKYRGMLHALKQDGQQ